jgi:hypothetical protein
VNTERLPRRPEVADRPQRVREDEHAPLRPPEGRLPPEPVARDREELERRSFEVRGRDDVVWNVQRRRDRCAVAPVTVEELQHAAWLAESLRPSLGLGPRDGIDQPDAAGGDQRVRRPPEPVVVVEPAEAEVLLVAEAHVL